MSPPTTPWNRRARTGDLAGAPAIDEDWLVISTMHSAKGLEWDVVHVIHAADGNIPSDMALTDRNGLEEERRLFYVADDPARHDLNVYVPLRYHHRPAGHDRHSWAQPSRFLTDAVRATMDRGDPAARRSPATPRTSRPWTPPAPWTPTLRRPLRLTRVTASR